MKNQGSHGSAMFALSRLISGLHAKGVINQQSVFQRFMQLQWSAIKERCDRREVTDTFGERSRLSLALLRNRQALPSRAEIHDAGEFKQLDVDISFIRSYLSEKRLNGVSRQFGLDRMECDLRHIKEL